MSGLVSEATSQFVKMHKLQRAVRGTGPFPIDILRYDGSCPYSQSDSQRVNSRFPYRGAREITLIKHDGYHHSV